MLQHEDELLPGNSSFFIIQFWLLNRAIEVRLPESSGLTSIIKFNAALFIYKVSFD